MLENYDKIMQIQINKLNGERKKLLLHSCCAPCSSAVIERLANYFDITVLYYNPNIYPAEEYEKRKAEQLRYISILNEKTNNKINFFDVLYDENEFLSMTKSHENEKEGQWRCHICYEIRMRKTAILAKENHFDFFCTTLSVSPYKNSQWINEIGIVLEQELEMPFLRSNFKKQEGYKRSIELSRQNNLYRQHYCGCRYSIINSEE